VSSYGDRSSLDRGATASTVREVMARLSGVMQIAVEHGHLPANPVRALRKVPANAGKTRDRGRDDVTLYTLRHTHASFAGCYVNGFTIAEAARRLGHGPGLHVETYAHVIDGMNRKR
jgi:integrase